jgi:hypothetical protein
MSVSSNETIKMLMEELLDVIQFDLKTNLSNGEVVNDIILWATNIKAAAKQRKF